MMIYGLTHNFGDIERFYEMSYSKPTDNGMLQILNDYVELFMTVSAYFIIVYLFLPLLGYQGASPLFYFNCEHFHF